MTDTPVSIKRLTIPASMLATVLGGSAWLTTTRSDLSHLTDKFKTFQIEYKENKKELKLKIKELRCGGNIIK